MSCLGFGSNRKREVSQAFQQSRSPIGKEDLDVYKFIVDPIDKFYRGSEVKRILHGFLNRNKSIS